MQSKHNDDPPGLVLSEKGPGSAADDDDRKVLPVFLHVDPRPVPGVAFDIDPAAAHGVARRIPDVSVHDDRSAVHRVADRVLGRAVHLDLRAVQVRAQGVARNAVNPDLPAAHARADKAVAQAAVDLNVAPGFAQKRVQRGEIHTFRVNRSHHIITLLHA